jgi:hypothetical protein
MCEDKFCVFSDRQRRAAYVVALHVILYDSIQWRFVVAGACNSPVSGRVRILDDSELEL